MPGLGSNVGRLALLWTIPRRSPGVREQPHRLARMKVETASIEITAVEADVLAVGIFESEGVPQPLAGAAGTADAKAGFRKVSLLHPERPERALAVGLGKRAEMDAERARVAAALAV